MRPKFLILLFVLPLLSGFVDNDSIREELQDDRDRQVIGSGNPLGWEWVEKELPDATFEGKTDENGYEWLEYPPGSGINYYRMKDESSDWIEWTTSESSS